MVRAPTALVPLSKTTHLRASAFGQAASNKGAGDSVEHEEVSCQHFSIHTLEAVDKIVKMVKSVDSKSPSFMQGKR